MRVIAGSAKGRTLSSTRGATTRPTSDRVRGAIFDMLDAAGADYASVVDLYAGSGALGIEALSRGEGVCVFVERDRRACDVLRRNLEATNLASRASIIATPVDRAIVSLGGPYTLVFADPPYADDEAMTAIVTFMEAGVLTDHGLFVLEHSKRRAVPDTLGELTTLRERRYGDTVVSIYGYSGDRMPAPRPGRED